MTGDRLIQLIQDNARLNSDRSAGRIDVENLIQILAAVKNDPGAYRLSRQAGSAPACDYWDVHLKSDLHAGHQVGNAPRNNHAQRLNLIDAGVGAVELARSRIKANLALDMTPQMLGQSDALLLDKIHHESIVRRSSRSGK